LRSEQVLEISNAHRQATMRSSGPEHGASCADTYGYRGRFRPGGGLVDVHHNTQIAHILNRKGASTLS
jgi:hypothetical protein